MANNRNSRIKKLKEKVVEKLDELLESENDQIVLKSCTTILELDGGDDVGGDGSNGVKTLAELINKPLPNRGIGDE